MKTVINNAAQDKEKGLGLYNVSLDQEALDNLAQGADGDARKALNTLELAVFLARPDEEGGGALSLRIMWPRPGRKNSLTTTKAETSITTLFPPCTKACAAAIRTRPYTGLCACCPPGRIPCTWPDAWCDLLPKTWATPTRTALVICMAAVQSYQFLGSPEGELALVQACLYLATAPKSNAAYMAQKAARKKISQTGAKPVPLHIRNAPTGLMKELGYGAEYKYPHDYEGAYVPEEYMPEGLEGASFYRPTPRGYESVIKKRMDHWSGIKRKKRNSD